MTQYRTITARRAHGWIFKLFSDKSIKIVPFSKLDTFICSKYHFATLNFAHYLITDCEFSPTWNCVSLTRSTTSSEWKLLWRGWTRTCTYSGNAVLTPPKIPSKLKMQSHIRTAFNHPFKQKRYVQQDWGCNYVFLPAKWQNLDYGPACRHHHLFIEKQLILFS